MESNTTDIEKENLEAHVELCAERYNNLDDKLEEITNKVNDQGETITAMGGDITDIKDNLVEKNQELHARITKYSEKRSSQIIKWGIGLVMLLAGTVLYMVRQGQF